MPASEILKTHSPCPKKDERRGAHHIERNEDSRLMLLSIGIPAWNVERYLEETVRSVISQTKRDWNLVIIDDGSKDRTRENVLEALREAWATTVKQS